MSNDVSTFGLSRISGVLGARIIGLDLADALPRETIAELRAAFVDHQVLVFRDQQLVPEQQIAFGRNFGELDTHPFVEANPDHPEMIDIVTQPDDRFNFGGGWHTDVTFLDRPDLGSILYAVEVPPVGGDTLFANQHASYEALSDTMKAIHDGPVAEHSAQRQYGDGGQSTRSTAMKTKSGKTNASRL